METESSLEIKEFYGIQLKRLLPCLGLGTVRWLSTLLPLVSNFTQIPSVSESHFELPNLILLKCSVIILNLCFRIFQFRFVVIW